MAEFWRSVPWQTEKAGRVAFDRLRYRHDLTMAAAWHAGAMPRMAKIPPLKSVLLSPAGGGKDKSGVADPERIAALQAFMETKPRR